MTAVAISACAHCGLPVIGDGAFCCTGCAIVHAAITEHGLERFYDLRDNAAPARTTTRSYADFDDPAFHRVHVREAGGIASAALYLEDLRCTACVWLVESAPRCLAGLVDVRVDLGRARADVTWDPRACSLSAIARHLDRLGHAVHAYRGLDRDRARRREDRRLLVELGVAGAALGNLMLLAVAMYAGLFAGMASGDATAFRWASMLVAVPALGFAAKGFFRTALAALAAGRLHLDLPLSIGIAAGLGWGTVNVVRGAGEIYFDSLAMLIFVLLVARWIVLRYQRRASTAAELLLALTPSRAHRVVDGALADVPVEALAAGDVVRVLVGETIPVDGTVACGRSAIDVGLLTGESRPIDVELGARVHAGTVNVAAPIDVRTSATGEATRVGALVASIERLSARRAPIERLVDRVAGRFVVVVTALAVLTFAGWAVVSVTAGAEHAMALLVVTCPCALALATPLAVTVALGRAARRGILVKGADALERLATPGVMYLDKTGTVTAGELAVASWRGDLDAAELAAAVEAGSNHPIARALVRHAATRRTARDVREELGRGIAGRVGSHLVAVGAPAWIAGRVAARPLGVVERAAGRLGVVGGHAESVRPVGAIERRPSRTADAWVAELAASGETPVAIAVDGHLVAVAGLADPIRPDARAAIGELAALGWHVELLSGDDPRVVERVGADLGIAADRCRGNATPEDKAAVVARASDPVVVMVGDGVNDAAAMAAATAGIAVSGAAEIAIEAADVYLRAPSIRAIADTAAGARATLATIRRNLAFSLVYNLVAGTLAVAGVIHPLIAAVAMPVSSLTVLASSLRSRAFAGPR